MSKAIHPAAESWDEARDWRRFWWLLPPLTFVMITLSMAWLTGFRNDGGESNLKSLSEPFYLNSATGATEGTSGRNRLGWNPLSIAGLVAIVLVMAGSHVVVARYDILAQDLLGSGCIFAPRWKTSCTPSVVRRKKVAK